MRLVALLVLVGCSSREAAPSDPLVDAFEALCRRKLECIQVIKDVDGGTKSCVAMRVRNAADFPPDALAALRLQVFDQARQCLPLPCDQYDACEKRVFDEHLAQLH